MPNTKTGSSIYFVGPVTDTAILGGASVLAYGLLAAFHERVAMEHIYAVSAALLLVVNWPHFSATVYRLYHSRTNVAQYPMTALVVPLVILAGVWASFAEPNAVAPYFIKLYLIWSPYHFSGQTLGISLLYARRANVKLTKPARFALAGFIYATFILPTVSFETGRLGNDYYGVPYPTLGLPRWTLDVAQIWLGLCALALVALFVRAKLRGAKLPPAIFFLPALTQFIWFVPGSRLAAFNEFVPMFHSLQYLFIAWSLQLKERMDVEALAPSRRYALWESVRWLLVNIVGGLLLFETLPLVFSVAGAPAAFTTGIIFAAVQIHHFFVDGVIWKLKSPAVASPLMVRFSELVGTPARP